MYTCIYIYIMNIACTMCYYIWSFRCNCNYCTYRDLYDCCYSIVM